MERIDILTPQISDCPSFVVNVAASNVDVTIPGAGDTIMYAGNDEFKFVKGDSVIILSAGYFIPEQFKVYGYGNAGAAKNSVPEMYLKIKESPSGAFETIWTFGSGGRMNLPFPNYEFAIGTFFSSIDLSVTDPYFSIVTTFPWPSDADKLQISMANVPVAFDGKTFVIVPFIKVLHTLPLTH